MDYQMNFNLTEANAKTPADLNTYITQFFYPLRDGNHIVIQNGKPVVMETAKIKAAYFNRLPEKANKFYFKEYYNLREIACQIGKPMIQDDVINMCPQFLHKAKPYEEYSDEAKAGVGKMLKYLKEIWANDNDTQYTYLIKWFANMTRGNKNQAILYCKAIQGVGKSTFTDFIMDYVIGPNLSLMSGSEPIKTRFNSALLAKLLVVFEELENTGVNEWQTISANLKRHATAKTINIESKGVDAYTTDNINNYIINTNVNAIKDSEGRRYYLVEISSKRKGDFAYFDDIRKTCFNLEVGEAFFSYLAEMDLTGFNCSDFPETAGKLDAIVDRLDPAYVFLKTHFIFKNIGISSSVSELYGSYVDFCKDNQHKSQTKNDFNQKMKDININYYKSNSALKYKISHEDLLAIAQKNKWISALDEYNPSKVKVVTPIMYKTDDLENGVVSDHKEIVSENARLKQEILALKAQLDKDQSVTDMEEEIKRQKAEIEQLKSVKIMTTEERYKMIVKEFEQTNKIKPKKTAKVKEQVITQKEVEEYYDLF